MNIAKEKEYQIEEDGGIEEDEEFEEEMEKIEAMSRQIYDTKERRYDDRNRCATDLMECGRVTLPKPLETKDEALIEMRREINDKKYEGYRQEHCNKKGEVQGNLSEEEIEGLRSLQKRMKKQEIIIMKTDKSGKLCVASREEYLRM